MDGKPAFTEHRVPREHGRVYARNYEGSGPAFVLMHGFPDNLGIYDDLTPYLTSAGRRVVAFDFLGFGASDKPADASYGFGQQLGESRPRQAGVLRVCSILDRALFAVPGGVRTGWRVDPPGRWDRLLD